MATVVAMTQAANQSQTLERGVNNEHKKVPMRKLPDSEARRAKAGIAAG
jgi:hypothetical protein